MALKASSWVMATLPQVLHPPSSGVSSASLAPGCQVTYGSGPGTAVLLSSHPFPIALPTTPSDDKRGV